MPGMRQKFCGAARTLPTIAEGGFVAMSSTVSLRCGAALVLRLIETHGTRAMSRVALRCARQALHRLHTPCCALYRLYGGVEAMKRCVFQLFRPCSRAATHSNGRF